MDLSKLVDYCLGSKGAPSDVAQVVGKILESRHRYVGDKAWEFFDPVDNTWKPDENAQRLNGAIRVDVCQAFIDRAMHYQNQSATPDMSAKIDCQLRCQKLLEICLKLKKDPFIKFVIKEARAFMSTD